MFVRNRSRLAPVLAKGLITPERAALSVSVELVFDIADEGHLIEAEPSPRRPTDPPDVRDHVLWRGTSVTAFALVDGPPRAPFARTVRLGVGGRVLDLAIYGDRHWERRLGQWVQTPPAPFEQLPLSWARAFGGTVTLEPHRTASGLPHPGGTVPHALNPSGRGLCVEGAPIEGVALPNVEDPRALIRAPHDSPTPHGFAPCPDLFGLRLTPAHFNLPQDPPLLEAAFGTWVPLRMQHHAPHALLFEEALSEGAVLELAGHAGPPIRTRVPPCPARVRTRTGAHVTVLAPHLRSVHLDGHHRQLRVSWGHASPYSPRRAPQWLDVEAA